MNYDMSPAALVGALSNPKAFVDAALNFFRANKGVVSEKSIGKLAFYDQRAVAGSGAITSFFTGAFSTTASNLGSSYIRPQDEHLAITALKIYDGAGATITAIGWNAGVSDAAAKNGLLNMSINGVNVLKNIPLSDFNPDVTDGSQGIFYLPNPIAWLGQQDLQIQVSVPGSPAANYSMRIELIGIGSFS